jgi:hypothetical protein
MNVIGHDDGAYDHEAITPADFLEDCQKQIATLALCPTIPGATTARTSCFHHLHLFSSEILAGQPASKERPLIRPLPQATG